MHACYEMANNQRSNNTNQKTCLCLKRDSTKRERLKTINMYDMNMKGKVEVAQLCPTLCNPGQNTGVVAFPFSRVSSQPRDQTQGSNPTLQADSLPTEL